MDITPEQLLDTLRAESLKSVPRMDPSASITSYLTKAELVTHHYNMFFGLKRYIDAYTFGVRSIMMIDDLNRHPKAGYDGSGTRLNKLRQMRDKIVSELSRVKSELDVAILDNYYSSHPGLRNPQPSPPVSGLLSPLSSSTSGSVPSTITTSTFSSAYSTSSSDPSPYPSLGALSNSIPQVNSLRGGTESISYGNIGPIPTSAFSYSKDSSSPSASPTQFMSYSSSLAGSGDGNPLPGVYSSHLASIGVTSTSPPSSTSSFINYTSRSVTHNSSISPMLNSVSGSVTSRGHTSTYSAHLNTLNGTPIISKPVIPSYSPVLSNSAYSSLISNINAPVSSAPLMRNNNSSERIVPVSSRGTTPDSFYKPTFLRRLFIPNDLIPRFTSISQPNTNRGQRGIETCAVIAGQIDRDNSNQEILVATLLLIPKQKGESDCCEMDNEHELIEHLGDCIMLGWIHTHPSQECFLSSMDVHTHLSYQLLIPEAIAIVIAPRANGVREAIFRLTDSHSSGTRSRSNSSGSRSRSNSYGSSGTWKTKSTVSSGIEVIQDCNLRGFHPHDVPFDIYEKCKHVSMGTVRNGAYISNGSGIKVIDLR